jgi:hypothetical protein
VTTRLGGVALAFALLALNAPSARGDDEAGADVRVDYPVPAPARCPAAATFREKLSTYRRAAASRRQPATNAETLTVRMTHRAGASGVEGELVVRFADGTTAHRVVDGETCASVVDALALMSAMTIDGPPINDPAVASVPPPPPPVPAEPEPAPDAHDSGSVLDLDAGYHFAAGFAGGPAFGIAPVVTPNISAFGELDLTRASVFSPMVRLSLAYATSGENAGTGGGALATSLTDATIDVCPVRWTFGGLRLAPCAFGEAGALAASGYLVTPARSAVRPWAAVGALGRVRYVFQRRFFVELSGGATLPLVRDRFFFEPDTTAYRAPAITGAGAAALGVTIL